MSGIFYALGSLFCAAGSDFITQRSTRKIGVWQTLFFISLWGAVAFFPFAFNDLHLLFGNSKALNLLILLAVIAFFSAAITFKAFKVGKLSVVEPIIGFELPLTVLLSLIFWHESLSFNQLALIVLIFVGIMLAVTIDFKKFSSTKVYLEKGVVYAMLAGAGLGFANFFVGVTSNLTSPLASFWFLHACFLIVTSIYLGLREEFGNLWSSFKVQKKIIIPMIIIDNFAWYFFAMSTTLIPISVATAISESYIGVAALMGIFINREKVLKHQAVGIAVAICGVVLLSIISV